MMKNDIAAVLALALGLTVAGCSQKKEVKRKSSDKPLVGNYIYYDKAGILHTRSGCKSVYKVPNIGTRPVRAKAIAGIWDVDLNNICSQCVTTDQLEFLVATAKANLESAEIVDTIAVE